MYKFLFKRFFDLLLALVGFILLSPIFVVVAILLVLANKGNPFFFQARPGKNEQIFKVIKFKTMSDRKNSNGELLHDADRLTPVGAFVRKTSLDEIPQLLNVIVGDMSLVGPRPLLPEYLPFYSDKHKQRHLVRPGITGLAQVGGRNNMKFSERFDLDVQYVQNLSFALDLKILFLTGVKIFKTSDIVHGQTVDEVDDLGITKNLSSNHFKKGKQ
jgi:lipopolysaccharide/colanic/teichoic acid biosynthesis glycosyltransferase